MQAEAPGDAEETSGKGRVMKKLLILTLLLIISAPAAGSDDQGGSPFRVRWEGNGHYYARYYGHVVQRNQASSYCGSLGGKLVSITSAGEQNFLNELRLQVGLCTGCWIGLQRECPTCWWRWDDGEPFCPQVACYWGFYGNEGSEATDELFASMETFGVITNGLWGSSGDGIEVLKPCFFCEWPNPAPTADAGGDRWVIGGAPVTLDGGNSSDPDEDYPLIFFWELSSRPDGSAVVLDDLGSVTPSFTPDVPGTYGITLVVYDTYGAESDPDQVTIEALFPESMIEDLIQEVDASADLSEATKISLVASLLAALKVLEDSNPKNDVAALGALEAFVNKLEAQRGKKIPDELAEHLTERAQDIFTVLDGGE